MATPTPASGVRPPHRRRGLRRVWLVLASVLLALLVLLALGAFWLLQTGGGRDFALARARAAIADLDLRYADIEGSLAGPLVLHDASLALGDTTLRARRLTLDLAPFALLGGHVRIESIGGEGVDVILPADSAQAGAPEDGQPFRVALPDLDLPVDITVEDADFRNLRVLRRTPAAAPADAPAPGAASAPPPREDPAGLEPVLAVDRAALAGSISRDGQVQVPRLDLRTDRGRVQGEAGLRLDGGRTGYADLTLTRPGEDGAAQAAQLRYRGEGERAALAIALPGQQSLRFEAEGGHWQVDSRVQQFDPSAWWPGWEQGPVTVMLDASGEGERIQVASGEIAIAGEHLRILRSDLRLPAGGNVLVLEPLVLVRLVDGQPAGQATLRGTLPTGGAGAADLEGMLEGVVLPGEGSGTLGGELAFTGTPDAYALQFDGTLVHPEATVPFAFSGTGSSEAIALEQLVVRAEGGGGGESLRASGRVAWSPQVSVDLEARLDGFNPGRFHGAFPGSLSGALGIEAARSGAGDAASWTADLAFDPLQGTLRGEPLSASGRVRWGGGSAESDLSVRLGDSDLRIAGNAGEQLDLEVRLRPLVLDDWMAGAEGRLQGTVQVGGSLEAPLLDLDVEGTGLVVAGQAFGSLQAEGRVSPTLEAASDLSLRATEVRLGGLAFAALAAGVSGTRADHRLQLELEGEPLSLALRAGGGWQQEAWRGSLDTLTLEPGEYPTWTLDAAAPVAVDAGRWELGRACLGTGDARACVAGSGDGATQRLSVALEELPLQGAMALANAGEPLPWLLEGTVSGEAGLLRQGEALAVDATFTLPAGRLSLEAVDTREVLSWQDLVLRVESSDGRIAASATGTLEETGALRARLSAPLPGQPGPLDGRIEASLPRLRVLELASPHIADADGVLEADLTVSGSWDDPRLQGELALRRLAAELPALGIAFRDSTLVARPAADGSLQFEGHLAGSEGALEVEGAVEGIGGALTARASVAGERVLVSDTPMARVLFTPELSLAYDAGDGLLVEGIVAVPEARLDLELLESDVEASDDVVVVDPHAEHAGQDDPLPIRADVTLVLGDAVLLDGFGFEGRVSGTLKVRERPGRVTTGRGTLEVTGEYTAYGQDLEIVQGRLLYSGTPLDNPALDVRAEREIGEQAVGLRIRGDAQTPELEIFAEPPLEQAEALSYLVLGRPLNAATNAESGQLSQAAAAIGGNFLAERLGGRLGFDTFEVGDSDALGATAFTVGKYLSPRLYVSYGMALFEEGSVLTLRYILSPRFELELESGAENRVGVNYTVER